VILAADGRADGLLDVAKLIVLFRGEQRERDAALARAGRTADAVDVVLGHGGEVEVDDVADAVDVDAAGDDVGRDEDAGAAALEAVERLLALRLRAVAVDGGTRDARAVERLGDAVGAMLGAGEDQHALELVILDEREQQVDLLLAADGVDRLCDLVDRLVGGRDIHADRLVQRVGCDTHDLGGHRGREQQVLAAGGKEIHDPLHVRPEAHVEHAVSLVEHEHLDAGQIAVALVAQVEQATRGGDKDVDSSAKRLGLRLIADATVDHSDLVLREARRLLGDAFDLSGELTGGGDDEGDRLAVARRDALQGRQHEGRRLAGAGLRAADDVASGNDGRDGLFLDGRGRGIAHGAHRLQEAWVET